MQDFFTVNGFDLEIQQHVIDQEAMNVALEVAKSNMGREELADWIAARIYAI